MYKQEELCPVATEKSFNVATVTVSVKTIDYFLDSFVLCHMNTT